MNMSLWHISKVLLQLLSVTSFSLLMSITDNHYIEHPACLTVMCVMVYLGGIYNLIKCKLIFYFYLLKLILCKKYLNTIVFNFTE